MPTFKSCVTKKNLKTGSHVVATLGLAALSFATTVHAEQFCKSVDASGATSYILAPTTGCNKKKFTAVHVSHHITPQPAPVAAPAPAAAAPAATTPAATPAATTTPTTTAPAAPTTTAPAATTTVVPAAPPVAPAATNSPVPSLNVLPIQSPKVTTNKF